MKIERKKMKKLMLITSIATLMACGGGVVKDSPNNNNQSPPVINKAPTDVVLSDSTSTKNTVFLKWSAKDDYSTNKLKYEEYANQFKPLPNGLVSTYFYSYWTQK